MPEFPRNVEPPSGNITLFVDGDVFERQCSVLRHLVVGLVDQALPVRVVTTEPEAEALALGPVQVLRRGKMSWPFAGRRLSALIDALAIMPPTVLHAFSEESYELTLDLAEEFDAEVIWSATSLADVEVLARSDLGRVDKIATHSQAMAGVLRERLGLGTEKLEVLAPGVLAADTPSAFAETERQPTIISTSPLDREACVEALILAVDQLTRRSRNVSLFLLGQGPQESSLRRLVRDRRLLARVTFAHPSGDTTPALRHADVFVRSGRITAFEDGSLRAMAAGLVVLIGPTEVDDPLVDGDTVVQCDPTSPSAIAETLERLLANVEDARAIAGRALEYVRTHHTISGMADRTAGLYRDLVARRATYSVGE